MTVRTKERRACRRVAAAYPLTLLDDRGRALARGRTANISAGGVYALVRGGRRLGKGHVIRASIRVPTAGEGPRPRPGRRDVCYRSRVVRVEDLGELTGVALAFLRKLS